MTWRIWTLAALVLGRLVLLLAALSPVAGWARSIGGRRRSRQLEIIRATRREVLEGLLADFYRLQGYAPVRYTDPGADLALRRGDHLLLVQLDDMSSQPVNADRIRQLHEAIVRAGAHNGVAISMTSFSEAARTRAAGAPLALIGGRTLIDMLLAAPGPASVARRQPARALQLAA